jgi:5-methylcytosine-specific restriction enzyme A
VPALKPCIEPGCRNLTTGGPYQRARCAAHQALAERRKRARRPADDHTERQRRARAVAAHVAAHGYVCLDCPYYQRTHPADPVDNPLTADHVIPVGAGGPEGGPLRVLCRRGNSSRGARVALAERISRTSDMV